jgi:5-formyltetrahydrofolate cyclo-ligase
MEPDTVTELPELRQRLRALRRGIDPATRADAALSLARRVSQLAEFSQARTIAAYVANEGEMDPQPLVEMAWKAGKAVYLPIISPRRQLRFGRYRKNTKLVPRTFGILEPPTDGDDSISPSHIDLVLMPLVAFDPDCNRVGMGGGYYDRAFEFLNIPESRTATRLIGVAYELQKVHHIECRSWDLPLHAVATERQLYRRPDAPLPE